MYSLKMSSLLIVSILVCSLILPQKLFGLSCPPCTAEQNALQQAKDRLQRAKDALNPAEEKVQDAEDVLRFASAAFLAAEAAWYGACVRVPTFWGCAGATMALGLAAAALDYANSKYQQAAAELQIARTEVQIAVLLIQNALKKLQACQARANPGECKKCENGTIQNDNGAPCDDGDECTKDEACMGGECGGGKRVNSRENDNCR